MIIFYAWHKLGKMRCNFIPSEKMNYKSNFNERIIFSLRKIQNFP